MPTINSLSVLTVHEKDPSKPDKAFVPCCMPTQHDELLQRMDVNIFMRLLLYTVWCCCKLLAVLELIPLPFLLLCPGKLPVAKPTANLFSKSLLHLAHQCDIKHFTCLAHEHSRKASLVDPQLQYCDIVWACAVQQGAFSDLEDLLDASHKLVEESVDSRARSQQASPAVTRDILRQVSCHLQA